MDRKSELARKREEEVARKHNLTTAIPAPAEKAIWRSKTAAGEKTDDKPIERLEFRTVIFVDVTEFFFHDLGMSSYQRICCVLSF